MAPKKFSLETPAGQQILKDYLNCFSGGYPPIPPYGVKEHFQKHKMYTDLRGPSTFSTQCKLIAPVAHQQMPQDVFEQLLQHVDGKYPNDKRKASKVKKELQDNRNRRNTNQQGLTNPPPHNLEFDSEGSDYDSDDEFGDMISGDVDFNSDVDTLKDSYIQPPVGRKDSASLLEGSSNRKRPGNPAREVECIDLAAGDEGEESGGIEDLSQSFNKCTLNSFSPDPSDPIIDKHLSEPWYMILFQMSGNLINMEDQMLTFSSDGRILTYKIKVDGVHLHASSMLRVPRSDSDVNQMTITRELRGREHLILGSTEKIGDDLWKSVHKFRFPSRVEPFFYNASKHKVNFPLTVNGRGGNKLCIFWLNEEPTVDPNVQKLPNTGHFFIPEEVHFALQGSDEVSVEEIVDDDEMVPESNIPIYNNLKNPPQVHHNQLPPFQAPPGHEISAASLINQHSAVAAEGQVARLQSQLNSLQGKLDMQKIKIASMEQGRDQASIDAKASEQEVRNLNERILALQDELSKAREEKMSALNQVQQHSNQGQAEALLQRQISSLQQQLQSSKLQHEHALRQESNQVEALKKEVGDLIRSKEEYLASTRKLTEGLQTDQMDQANKEAQLKTQFKLREEELMAKISGLQEEMAKAMQGQHQQSSQAEHHERMMSLKEEELTMAKQNYSKLDQEFSLFRQEAQAQIQSTKLENSKLQGHVRETSALEQELQVSKAQIAEFQNLLINANHSRGQAENELGSCKMRIQILEADNSTKSADLAKVKSDLHELKKQRDAERLKHSHQGSAENERLKAELTAAQAEFSALQEENRQLGVKCQNLETKMSTLQTQLYVAKLDKEKYFEELRDLKDAEAQLETRSVMSSSSRGPQASAFKILNDRLSKMVVEMGSVKADLEAQKKKVEARESEIKSKDSLVKTLQANAATLQEKLDEAQKNRTF